MVPPSAGPLTVYASIRYKFATFATRTSIGSPNPLCLPPQCFLAGWLGRMKQLITSGHFVGICDGDNAYLIIRAPYRSYCSVKSQ